MNGLFEDFCFADEPHLNMVVVFIKVSSISSEDEGKAGVVGSSP
jgi:hypothetical protein